MKDREVPTTHHVLNLFEHGFDVLELRTRFDKLLIPPDRRAKVSGLCWPNVLQENDSLDPIGETHDTITLVHELLEFDSFFDSIRDQAFLVAVPPLLLQLAEERRQSRFELLQQ